MTPCRIMFVPTLRRNLLPASSESLNVDRGCWSDPTRRVTRGGGGGGGEYSIGAFLSARNTSAFQEGPWVYGRIFRSLKFRPVSFRCCLDWLKSGRVCTQGLSLRCTFNRRRSGGESKDCAVTRITYFEIQFVCWLEEELIRVTSVCRIGISVSWMSVPSPFITY